MMGTIEFMLATSVILLTPGPTNTLLALSGSQVGFVRSLKLFPAELSGYLLAAAIWVMYLAAKLWLHSAIAIEQSTVSTRRVFVTTLLNPKALLFGLVLLPPSNDVLFLPRLAIFGLSILGAASLWATAGKAIVNGTVEQNARRRLWLHRCAAVWLAVLSAGLATDDLFG
jgi:threonine/homoserine/homoserine lactone efflux protein